MGNIVDVVVAAGSFKTLVTAIKAAGLDGMLRSDGPFTVFAPNDDAFLKLSRGTVEELLKDIPRLKTVIAYHVASGRIMAADIVKLRRVKTVQGQEVSIDASRWHLHKNVKVDDANIIKADVVADNGVIHIIDEVIFPKERLSYLVKDYMIKETITVDSDATVVEAAKVMAADENYEGYAIVTRDGKPIGIVTERDIINKALAKGLDTSKTKVSEIMTSPLITVDPDEDLLEASKLMAKRDVRKLVVAKDEIVYGIITANEIAKSCGKYVDIAVRDTIQWTAVLAPTTY